MKHYIVIINDLEIRDEIFSAREIIEELFQKQTWLFSKRTPKLKTLAIGDQVVVYAAGKNNRCFMGTFTLSSLPALAENNSMPLVRLYPLECKISKASLWKEPKPIKELLPQLSFIVDKKNYGLYLRQGLREIPQSDFEEIVRIDIS